MFWCLVLITNLCKLVCSKDEHKKVKDENKIRIVLLVV